ASGGGSIEMAERKAGQSPGGATDGLGARGTLTARRMSRLAAGPAGPAALPDGARDATEGSALDVCAVPRTSPAMSLPPPLAGEGRGGGGRARPAPGGGAGGAGGGAGGRGAPTGGGAPRRRAVPTPTPRLAAPPPGGGGGRGGGRAGAAAARCLQPLRANSPGVGTSLMGLQ